MYLLNSTTSTLLPRVLIIREEGTITKLTSWIKHNQLVSFYILTFTITWGLGFPFAKMYFQEDNYLAGIAIGWSFYGPALSGIFITRMINPNQNERERRNPLLAFFVGLVLSTFVFILNIRMQVDHQWTSQIAIGVTFWGLMIAIAPAYVISSAFSANPKIRDFLQTLYKPRGAMLYYIMAVLLPLTEYWIGSLISDTLNLSIYYRPSRQYGWYALKFLSITFFYQFFYANTLGEEVGWRGFAQPRLQAKFSPLISSLIMTPIWFAWHLPLKLSNPDVIPYLFYFLIFIPSSVFLTWVYNRTNGDILAVGLAHVSGNLAGKFLFPISNSVLFVKFIVTIALIFIDRMWDKSTVQKE